MKRYFILLIVLVSSFGFAQNNYIVKTDDGRRVLLKADYTWEYIDAQPLIDSSKTKSIKSLGTNGCNLPADFKEPKPNSKIQAQLKKGRANIEDIKRKVAKDYDCDEQDVILLALSEKKGYGNYTFCANGTKVFYKRNGFKILEKGKLF
ncbi:hypothetical protein MHTCC0001_00920 [Flavobacteriaceae bacterium MHTCC 0001]